MIRAITLHAWDLSILTAEARVIFLRPLSLSRLFPDSRTPTSVSRWQKVLPLLNKTWNSVQSGWETKRVSQGQRDPSPDLEDFCLRGQSCRKWFWRVRVYKLEAGKPVRKWAQLAPVSLAFLSCWTRRASLHFQAGSWCLGSSDQGQG